MNYMYIERYLIYNIMPIYIYIYMLYINYQCLQELLTNLKSNLLRGNLLRFQFCGKTTEIPAAENIHKAAVVMGLIPETQSSFKYLSTHDIDSDAIKVKYAMMRDDGTFAIKHCFGPMCHRWKGFVLEHLVKLRPSIDASPSECKSAYLEMHRYLTDLRQNCAESNFRPEGFFGRLSSAR